MRPASSWLGAGQLAARCAWLARHPGRPGSCCYALQGWVPRPLIEDLRAESDEGGHLSRGVQARRIYGIQREALIGPVGEQFDQPSAAQQMFTADLQYLGDTRTCLACAEKGSGVR